MPGYGARYWDERTPRRRRPSYRAFRGEATADAVVIGGGLTGCTAAYVLAAGGCDVVLLEAERLAEGGTAGSLGVVLPEPANDFRAAEQLAGRRVARMAWQETRRGAVDLAALLRKLRIRCDLAPAPLVVNARGRDEAERLRREQGARNAAGLRAPWMTPASAASAIRTESQGALRLADAFMFDPVRAALGLAAAAEARGARIFETSTVRRTRFTRKTADVMLATGRIRTRAIVVATGEPGALFGQLRRHVRRREGFVVVTDDLPGAVRREIGDIKGVVTEPDGEVWLRPMPDGRLLFAGAAGPPVAARLADKTVIQRTAQLMYELSVRQPSISGIPAAWGWRVPVVSTPDGLPWIGTHRNFPFHFFAMAMGWHGDGLASWAGRAALRFVRGEPRKEDEAFGFSRYL
jgi:glycine/D-amino acid oxidase-like deaminating enzyme